MSDHFNLVLAIEKLHKECMSFLKSIKKNKNPHQMSGSQLLFLHNFFNEDKQLLQDVMKKSLLSTDICLYYLNVLKNDNKLLETKKNQYILTDEAKEILKSIDEELKHKTKEIQKNLNYKSINDLISQIDKISNIFQN